MKRAPGQPLGGDSRAGRPDAGPRGATWRALVLLCMLVSLASPRGARASFGDDGALTAHGLVGSPGTEVAGGALLVDLWHGAGPLRIGAAAGLGFLAGDPARSRLFTPFGVSMALVSTPAPVGVALRLRAGGWSGATDRGFGAGGWLAAGFHIEYALDPRVSLSAGLDAWFLFGHGDTMLFAPGISLVWKPGSSE